jgi:hypothetical protein
MMMTTRTAPLINDNIVFARQRQRKSQMNMDTSGGGDDDDDADEEAPEYTWRRFIFMAIRAILPVVIINLIGVRKKALRQS